MARADRKVENRRENRRGAQRLFASENEEINNANKLEEAT